MKSGEFPNRLIPAEIPDRAFVMELVYGVVRWKRMLEWVLEQRARRQPDPELRALLLIGLYQILCLSNVAAYAAVNETVAAAKASFGRGAADFINAIMRAILRDKPTLLAELAQQAWAIQASHPDVLIERWRQAFGETAMQQLCAWNNSRPEIVIRANSLKIAPAAYLAKLQAAGISALHQPAPGCFALPHGWRLEALPGYAEGLFLALDTSVLTAVELLNPRPGDSVLDACAAPGGKTFLIAERLQKQGRLVALDLHQDRLTRLRENLERLGCASFVEVHQGNAMNLTDEIGGPFERILLDAPCLNSGVIRRRPDARWRFSARRLARLTRIQRALLLRAADLLKPGGSLVYSTCSLEPEENELQAAAFLEENPQFYLVAEHKIFPPTAKSDGAYAALLKRKA